MAEKKKQVVLQAAEKAAAEESPDFWDNAINAIINRVLGSGQLMQKLGISLGPNAPSEDEIREAIKDSRPTEGWGGTFGDIVAGLPAMGLPGGPIAQGIAGGALTGITEPVRGADESERFFEEKATQGAIGGAIGGAMGTVAKLFGGIARHSPEKYTRDVMDAAVPPDGATITKPGHEGFRQLKAAWDKNWAKVIPGLKVTADVDLVNGLKSVQNGMEAMGYTADQIGRVGNIIQGQILGPAARGETGGVNQLAGEAAHHVQTTLRKLALQHPDIEQPLMQVREAVLDGIERNSTPDIVQQFRALRTEYPKFLAVEEASAAAATTGGGGLFTPQQLGSAARRLDKTAHHGATAAGTAPLQETVEAGLAARIGKPSPIVEAMQGLPIAGPVARMAERSPTVRGIAEGIEASNVPATTAAAGVMVPSATLTPGDIGEGYDWTPGGFPEHGDTKFDNGETDLNDFFMKDDNGDPELEQFFDPRTDEDMDKFFSPAYSESEVDRIAAAIWQQESSGRLRRPDGRQIISPSGAVGPMQIMPGTFRQYAKAGEDIYDADDNLAVGRRLIADLHGKYGDPRKVAAAYFSGKPNYNASASDVTGKTTASYVADVMNRMERGNANG